MVDSGPEFRVVHRCTVAVRWTAPPLLRAVLDRTATAFCPSVCTQYGTGSASRERKR